MADKTLNTHIVLRNDTAENWRVANPVLLKGEAGYETDTQKLKFGDGSTTWNDLPYFGEAAESVAKVYQIEVAKDTDHLDAIAGVIDEGAELHNGDIAIVKELISGDKREYTAYVYDGENWVAMDGNVSADNVYFTKNLIFTQTFGKFTPGATGSVEIPTAANGLNLQALLEQAFAEEKNPTITQPSVSITLTGAGAKEVGTVFTPSYSVGFNAGKYQYGPATGVTATTYAVTDTLSHSATTATGSFTQFTVDEDTNYKVSVTVQHSEGAVPKTNLNNDYAEGQIEAGSKSATSSVVTGYRGWFYGYYNGTNKLADATKITSTQLRAFGVKTDFPATMSTEKMQQMFFAAPQGKVTSVGVADATNGAPETVLKTTVNVEGVNAFEAIPYDVFYVSNATAKSGANKFNITTKKA